MSSRSDLRLHREEHALPKTVDGIISLMREVLSGGNVYKFVLESGTPVLVLRRRVDSDLDEYEVTLDDALQQAEFLEYENEGATSFEVLFDIFHVVDNYGFIPVCWATGMNQTDLLSRWVQAKERGLPGTLDSLLGIPIYRMKVLPEDTLILCGSRRMDGEVEDVSLGVKTSIELREATHDDTGSEADHPIGDHPEGDAGPVGEVEAPPEGGPRGSWIPPAVPGGGVGKR